MTRGASAAWAAARAVARSRRTCSAGVEGPLGVGRGPVVVEVQRRAVIDEPDVAVPDQEVRVAPGAVDVLHERVEPEHLAGELRLGRPAQRVEAERAGQEVHAEVQALAGPQQVLDLRVGLADGDPGVEPGQHQLGYPQAQAAGELAGDDLGDQGERPLAGAAELHHVGAEVVRLDDGGQRPALAQRGHVPRHRDMFEHAARLPALGWRQPERGNRSALNVVISAITPPSMRMTSSLNARNTLSPAGAGSWPRPASGWPPPGRAAIRPSRPRRP